MLQNLTNFFNLITNRKIKKTLDNKDLLAIGTPDARFDGGYQPTAISYEDLEAQIAAGITPATPTLQAVVNAGNSITNFGGIGTASITSINFTNNRALYLNNDANPTIRIVDNLNPANNLQIDFDTLTLDGVSYNWSSIVNGVPSWLESDATDLTIWNNGKGNQQTNTSYGEFALRLNTSGEQNVAIGWNTLRSNTGGIQNTGIGCNAMYYNATGNYNTVIGRGALFSNTTGSYNTAVGNAALLNSNSDQNVAIGYLASTNTTTGSQNTTIGYYAGTRTTTGSGNIFLGNQTAQYNTVGSENTVIGYGSAQDLVSGFNNTIVGSNIFSGNFNSCIILGRNAQATASNQFVVGSVGTNAGSVVTAAQTQTKYWNVIINGIAQRILLA
jgi:hypothetical protein